MTFNDFNFTKDIAKGVKIAGFKEPSPIQELAIPLIISGKDLVGQAHTGTGKTAAFGLPIMNKIVLGEIEKVLIITPTRELAMQVSDELYHLGRFAGIRTLSVYGGVGYGRQIALINKGVQVVVATPGRLKDLYQKGKIESFNPQIVVLDEADEMLDMGFLDEIKEIFTFIPQTRQTLLFSATMPEPIKDLAKDILFEPEYISVIKADESTTNNNIEQLYYVIDESKRDEAIIKLLDDDEVKKSIIFCRTRKEVDRVSEHLRALGHLCGGLHGDMEQSARDEIVKGYRHGEVKILVATDVAARGLDIKGVSHVFNYHIPFDPQSYVHRIGRTGRAGKKGKAITLVSTEEFKELKRIQNEVGASLQFASIDGLPDENEILSTLKLRVEAVEVQDLAYTFIDSMEDMDYHEFVEKIAMLLVQSVSDEIVAKNNTFTTSGLAQESQKSRQKVTRKKRQKKDTTN